MRIMVTGGSGFIGSAVCRRLVGNGAERVVNVDKLTYAANPETLRDVADAGNYAFHRADICDGRAMLEIMRAEKVDAIMHLAAESHVDRSIDGPSAFIETNVVGTFRMLDAALAYWRELPEDRRTAFRFHHVSTDEVFGDLSHSDPAFREDTAYAPNSPYAASKASADHLARAWHRTYGLPVVLSNCSNNYGPYQFPEKLIPLMILNAVSGRELPVYGDGSNVRDWLFVEDHAAALETIVTRGMVGERYNVGGGAELTNLRIVQAICDLLDARQPKPDGGSYRDQIRFVTDRPGHDRRYAIDASHVARTLGWQPSENLETGLAKTVDWYLDNAWWWEPIRSGRYAGERLGTAPVTAP